MRPDERLDDAVYDFARAVWHLQDRLHQLARTRKNGANIPAYSHDCRNIQICRDLTNWKKHGGNDNHSKLDPWLGLPSLDTSDNGPIEFVYDGAAKETILYVTKPHPIRYWLDLYEGDGTGASHAHRSPEGATRIGNAAEIIFEGFKEWIPLLQSFGILTGEDPETVWLSQVLAPLLSPR